VRLKARLSAVYRFNHLPDCGNNLTFSNVVDDCNRGASGERAAQVFGHSYGVRFRVRGSWSAAVVISPSYGDSRRAVAAGSGRVY
jgi:hypothetical protein